MCYAQNVFFIEFVLYTMCYVQNVFSIECDLYIMCCVQNVFSIECVLYRMCYVQNVFSRRASPWAESRQQATYSIENTFYQSAATGIALRLGLERCA